MAIVISAAAQQAMLNALTAQINGGSGDTYGDFQLLTYPGDNPLAEVIFGDPAFGAASGSGPVTAVQSGTTITTQALPTSGNIGKGIFRNKSNTAVMTFLIGVGTGDLQVGSVTIGTGASSVDISGLTITLTVV